MKKFKEPESIIVCVVSGDGGLCDSFCPLIKRCFPKLKDKNDGKEEK